jgi:peptidoglycan-associated lipoprotein
MRRAITTVFVSLTVAVLAVGCASAQKKADPAPEVLVKKTVRERVRGPDLPPEAGPLYFGFDQHVLSPSGKQNLVEIAAFMNRRPEVKLVIDGHADDVGTLEYNLALGDKRAQAAMAYLHALGVSDERLAVVSYGEERPMISGFDEDSRSRNRRDEFTFFVEREITLTKAEAAESLDVLMAWNDWDEASVR